jgi:hypothetical protein
MQIYSRGNQCLCKLKKLKTVIPCAQVVILMKIKLLSALLILSSTLLFIFSMNSFADKAMPSVQNKNLAEDIPHITNEAEYADFVRKREGAGAGGSVKTIQSKKSSLSSGASSSRGKLKTQ